MSLSKMRKKKKEVTKYVKEKKKLSCSQYFYNIFTINHTWLIIISSKNLWQINCDNGIAEKKKNLWNLWMSKKKSCHVHNIFTINHTWLIIISSKNLWQINCGNGIAENVNK